MKMLTCTLITDFHVKYLFTYTAKINLGLHSHMESIQTQKKKNGYQYHNVFGY